MNNLEKSAFHPEIKILEKAKVQKPGSRGGKFWLDEIGNARYGNKLGNIKEDAFNKIIGNISDENLNDAINFLEYYEGKVPPKQSREVHRILIELRDEQEERKE